MDLTMWWSWRNGHHQPTRICNNLSLAQPYRTLITAVLAPPFSYGHSDCGHLVLPDMQAEGQRTSCKTTSKIEYYQVYDEKT